MKTKLLFLSSTKLQILIMRYLANKKQHQCYKLAFKLCEMGNENGEAQYHINSAKDELYKAARYFNSKIQLAKKVL